MILYRRENEPAVQRAAKAEQKEALHLPCRELSEQRRKRTRLRGRPRSSISKEKAREAA